MPAPASRTMIIYLLGPPALWSFHFLFVYVFVSLACLWTWDDVSFLGLGAIEWVVALATLGIATAIALIGLQGWRQRGDAPRLVFLARITVMMSVLSARSLSGCRLCRPRRASDGPEPEDALRQDEDVASWSLLTPSCHGGNGRL